MTPLSPLRVAAYPVRVLLIYSNGNCELRRAEHSCALPAARPATWPEPSSIPRRKRR